MPDHPQAVSIDVARIATDVNDAPPPPRVVLYVCTTRFGNTSRVLDELRTHAKDMGWEAVAEFADTTGAAPESERPGFKKTKALIAAGRADGIVTRYRTMAAYIAAEQANLDAWLTENKAFLHCTWKPTTPAKAS